jgi:regulator of sigma E protease
MDIVKIGQFLLSLSLLIILHEMGHFFPARWFKTRVEKFYLFFDPWFSILKFKRGDTEYGLGWLPLGGYVKISGMIDESLDTEQMKGEPQPWEFRSKPAWQRLIIMLGGVTVNFLLGFFIFGMVLWKWGEVYLPAANVKDGIFADSLGLELGLRNGDRILSVGNMPFEEFNERAVAREIVFNNAATLEVLRGSEKVSLRVPEGFSGKLASHESKGKMIFSPMFPFKVERLAKGAPAEAAGFKKGDYIVAINGSPARFYQEVRQVISANPGKPLQVAVLRGADTVSLSVTPSKEGAIGVYTPYPETFFQTERREYSIAQALPAGVALGWRQLSDNVKAFGQIFSGKMKASESLGGFASIADMYGSTFDWEHFWKITATLSLVLAFMNLLPIPALDGGHVMFLLYEVFTGRKPGDKFMEYATMVGFFLILALLLYANGLDIFRAYFK